MYKKTQCNVSQSERKSTIFTSEFRNCKMRAFVYILKKKIKVCKKRKRALTNLTHFPQLYISFE